MGESALVEPVRVIFPRMIDLIGIDRRPRLSWHLPRGGYENKASVFAVSKNHFTPKETSDRNFDDIVHSLNPQQRDAVLCELNRPCLVLAGPGSGKTRVLTHRAAYIVRKYNIAPYRVLAVTFTNKAAGEMKQRLQKLLKSSSNQASIDTIALKNDFAVGTFHSLCARMLRTYGDAIGIAPDFVICDPSDARQVVSSIVKKAQGAVDSGKVFTILSQISKLKNDGKEELQAGPMPEAILRQLQEYRQEYDRKLRSMNQLDFDDLLLETRRMIIDSPEVLEQLQHRYQHVLVDEWQDTNTVQFDIVRLLAREHKNLFVVGDADQSIYKFRGADSRNVDRFSEVFKNPTLVALEENYRSSACIVQAAQAVIEGNRRRPDKSMRTSNAFGEPVVICKAHDDREEAQFVVKRLKDLMQAGHVQNYSDIGVLYRTNAQSRLLEEACIKSSIPYRLVSGTRFYERLEVKDLLSYVRLLANPSDDLALQRAINTPPRGIGKKTVDTLEEYAREKNTSMLGALDVMFSVESDSTALAGAFRKAAVKKLADFHLLMQSLRAKAKKYGLYSETQIPGVDSEDSFDSGNVGQLITDIVKSVEYKQYLRGRGGDGKEGKAAGAETNERVEERMRNVTELESAALQHATLASYLENVALVTQTRAEAGEDTDGNLIERHAVSLMTLHAGKGLEFQAVFMTGVEDGLVPMVRRSDTGADTEADREHVEEERRLAYVGMTRAKQYLFMSWRSRKLVLQGAKPFYREDVKPSKFFNDVPKHLVKNETMASGSRSSASSRSYGPSRSSGPSGQWERRTVTTYSSSSQTSSPPIHSTAPIDAPEVWRVGDSVRCAEHGRGTITVGAPDGVNSGAWIEVLFVDGTKHYVNTMSNNVKLLFSPSA